MRARRGKRRVVPEWLSDFPQQTNRFGFMPQQSDIDSAMGGNTDIIAERAAREDALKAAVQYLREFGRTRPEDRAAVPRIAGYTDMAGGSPEMKARGFAEWLGKSPQQRYEDSALGQSESFSMEGPSPGRAVLSDMARGNSYWAGLARNVAYGAPLPEANLPRMGAAGGVEGEAPWARVGERAGGKPGRQADPMAGVYGDANLRVLAGEAKKYGDSGPAYENFAEYASRAYGLDRNNAEGAAAIRWLFDTVGGR